MVPTIDITFHSFLPDVCLSFFSNSSVHIIFFCTAFKFIEVSVFYILFVTFLFLSGKFQKSNIHT